MSTVAKLLRILNNESQQEVATYLGCSRDTLSRKELGKNDFTFKELKMLAKRYNVSLTTISDNDSIRAKILEVLQG